MRYRLRDNFTTNPELALIDILENRGVEDVALYMKPRASCELDPYDLENIDAAAELLLKHLRGNSRICVIVDADVDGYTSASILWLYIKNLFPNADMSFTVHEHKQHGLNDKIDWLIDEEQFDLVLCPDSASYDVKEHQRLHSIGTDVICIDHHEVPLNDDGEPLLPNPQHAIVVNNQLSPRYLNKSLCGAGVVYKLCEVLDDKLGIKQAQTYLDLVALGEIADVMDRTNLETNYLIMEGLRNIHNKGFTTLIESQSFSLKEKAAYPYSLTPVDVAFYIAPLLNAITRVGTMAEKENMFYCFVEPERSVQSTKRGAKPGDIELAAEATARCGANAKARQNRIKERAMDIIDFKIQKNQLDDNNIIIVELDDSDDIPQEMTGLIAMGVVSKYHKPVMIGRRNSREELQGSIRSEANFAGLPSFKRFLESSNLVEYVAGHDAAAGYGLRVNNLTALLTYANEQLEKSSFENCYLVDYVLDARKDNKGLLEAIASHPEYFGNHVDEVKIVVKNIPLSNIMAMGTNKDSMKISHGGIDYVRFKDTDFIYDVQQHRGMKLNVYGRANLNCFMGRTSVQVFIEDYELEDDMQRYEF